MIPLIHQKLLSNAKVRLLCHNSQSWARRGKAYSNSIITHSIVVKSTAFWRGTTIFSHNFQERQVMSVLIYKRISFMSIKIWWAHPLLLGSYQHKQKRSSKQSIWSYLCEISVRQDGWHRESIVLKGSSSYFIYTLLIQQQWAGIIVAAAHWVTSSKMVQKLDSTQSHSLYFDVISV